MIKVSESSIAIDAPADDVTLVEQALAKEIG